MKFLRLLPVVLLATACDARTLVEMFLHGSGGNTNPEVSRAALSIGLGVSGMWEVDSFWQAGMTYGIDLVNVGLIPNDPTHRQTLLPELGIRAFANRYCAISGRMGFGVEHWTTDYSRDYLGPAKPEDPYSVTHVGPVLSLALNEQIFYRWLGLSTTQRYRVNGEGTETGFTLGLLLRL